MSGGIPRQTTGTRVRPEKAQLAARLAGKAAGIEGWEDFPGYIETSEAMAALIGETASNFCHNTKRDGFPTKSSRLGWPVAQVIEWHRARGTLKVGTPPEPVEGVADYNVSKARKMAADAEKIELEVARRKNELVPVAEVEREWSTRIQALCGAMEKAIHRRAKLDAGKSQAEILVAWREEWRKIRERSAKIEAPEEE